MLHFPAFGDLNLRMPTELRRFCKGGASSATVCQETGLSKGTAQRALHSLPKNHLRCVSATDADLSGSLSMRKMRISVLLFLAARRSSFSRL